MPTLYGVNGSPFVRKVRVVLAEKDLEYEKIFVDLRKQEHLAIRSGDPRFLLFGTEQKAIRAHRREPAQAFRRIFRRFHEPFHVGGASRSGQHDSRHPGVEELQDQLRIEAARPHERREA